MINITTFPKIVLFNSNLTTTSNKTQNFAYRSLITEKTMFFPKKTAINFNRSTQVNGELIELIFFGLNYNAKRVKFQRKPFLLDLQKSHKIRVEEERVSQIKTKIFKRRLLLYSYDKNNLIRLVSLLKASRPINNYSGHGVIGRSDSYFTKPGKIRQK